MENRVDIRFRVGNRHFVWIHDVRVVLQFVCEVRSPRSIDGIIVNRPRRVAGQLRVDKRGDFLRRHIRLERFGNRLHDARVVG